MSDFDRHVDEAMRIVADDTDTPGPRELGKPRGSGATTGRDAWQRAVADHNRRKRNQRGRRSPTSWDRLSSSTISMIKKEGNR